jgi:hypothetical protein
MRDSFGARPNDSVPSGSRTATPRGAAHGTNESDGEERRLEGGVSPWIHRQGASAAAGAGAGARTVDLRPLAVRAMPSPRRSRVGGRRSDRESSATLSRHARDVRRSAVPPRSRRRGSGSPPFLGRRGATRSPRRTRPPCRSGARRSTAPSFPGCSNMSPIRPASSAKLAAC